jgi:hypothetical protein
MAMPVARSFDGSAVDVDMWLLRSGRILPIVYRQLLPVSALCRLLNISDNWYPSPL